MADPLPSGLAVAVEVASSFSALAAIMTTASWAAIVVASPLLAAEHIRPPAAPGLGNLTQVAISPPKQVLLASGSFARQLLVAMTSPLSLRAFGDHLASCPDRGHHAGRELS